VKCGRALNCALEPHRPVQGERFGATVAENELVVATLPMDNSVT
jgi:hypothetical protein